MITFGGTKFNLEEGGRKGVLSGRAHRRPACKPVHALLNLRYVPFSRFGIGNNGRCVNLFVIERNKSGNLESVLLSIRGTSPFLDAALLDLGF